MTPEKVTSLGGFTERVREIRLDWSIAPEKELWFRGENETMATPGFAPFFIALRKSAA